MPGKPGEVQLANEFLLIAAWRNKTFEVDFHGAIIRAAPPLVKKMNGVRSQQSTNPERLFRLLNVET
jgi:hypothetical protein